MCQRQAGFLQHGKKGARLANRCYGMQGAATQGAQCHGCAVCRHGMVGQAAVDGKGWSL